MTAQTTRSTITNSDDLAECPLEAGDEIELAYSPPNGDDSRTTTARVKDTFEGRFKHIAIIDVENRDPDWKVEFYKTGIGLYFRAGDVWSRASDHTEPAAVRVI